MDHYWLKAKEQWQCRECGFRTTLRSGTLFEASKLRLKTWFEAIFLIANSKKGLSSCELQRQLGLKRNEPAWYMMHKIRKAMARINEQQQIDGELEIDDTFFTTIQAPQNRADRLIRNTTDKRGGKAELEKALILVESMETTGEQRKKGKLRMFRTVPIGGNTIWQKEDRKVDFEKVKRGYRSRRILYPHQHEPQIINSNRSLVISPWIHTAIGNSRRLINGIHHHISTRFTQLYLDEFAFKFNFRSCSTRWELVFRHALNFHW